jgi:hypothetical protein
MFSSQTIQLSLALARPLFRFSPRRLASGKPWRASKDLPVASKACTAKMLLARSMPTVIMQLDFQFQAG